MDSKLVHSANFMPKRQSNPEGASASISGGPQRIQRILAAAGHGSRRECEELITTGRVEVDRQVITHLGAKADPGSQEIRVDGQRLANSQPVYYLVNKPVGVVTTNSDPAGRPRVIDLVPDRNRVFPVGRLDLSSEGLIIVTNDGDLANQLTHPRYGVEKTYEIEIAGRVEPAQFAKLKSGVHLAEGFARVVSVFVKKQRPQSTLLEMVLAEGKNREIRRILARVGHKVLRLKRTAIGPIKLADLPKGTYRLLSRQEVQSLRENASPRSQRLRKKEREATASKRKKPTPPGGAAPPKPAPAVPSVRVVQTSPAVETGPVVDLPVRFGKGPSRPSRRVLGEPAPKVFAKRPSSPAQPSKSKKKAFTPRGDRPAGPRKGPGTRPPRRKK
jgi:23S rRNA pseudouridine2605 synthase